MIKNSTRLILFNRQLWTPANISGALALWLDAADLSTITLNGSNVSEWRDKSGNALHVSQVVAGKQPTYTRSGLNSQPTLDWGSSINDRVLSRSNMINYSPVQYFGVADYDGPDPFTSFSALITHPASNAPTDLLLANDTGSVWWSGARYFLNGSRSSSTVALPTINNPFVFATDFSPSPNRTSIFIGQDRDGFPGRGWKGKISEIISVRTLLSTAEQQNLIGYLAHKWKLTADLSDGHPFKFTAPRT